MTQVRAALGPAPQNARAFPILQPKHSTMRKLIAVVPLCLMKGTPSLNQ